MIDDHRVRQMAREYDTNPSTARRLLEGARDVPALRIGRRYRLILAAAKIRMGIEKMTEAASEATGAIARIRSIMMGGDAGGQENTETVPAGVKGG